MQNRQNGRRRRGGGNNNPRPMGQPMGGQSANRLEVRVRGNAHQLLEKYKVMARDAHQAGDRVAAEYYLQHADHYFRVLNDARIRQEEMRARRSGFDRYEEDVDDGDEGAEGEENAAEAPREERAERPERYERNDRQPREDRGNREERGNRQDRGNREMRDDREYREDRGRRDERGNREGNRDDGGVRVERRERIRTRPDRAPRQDGDEGFAPVSDGEAALVAFGGAPQRDFARQEEAVEAVAESAAPVVLNLGADPVDSPLPLPAEQAAADVDTEAKPVRRRGRPRKVDVQPAEG